MPKLSMKYCLTVLTIVLMVQNAQGLNVEIVPSKPSFGRSEGVFVTLKYENNGQDQVLVKFRFLPKDISFNRILNVTQNGKSVEYVGRVAKLVPDNADNAVPVQPGQSVSTTIDISGDYDFSKTGVYKITLNGDVNTVIFNTNQPAGSNTQNTKTNNKLTETTVSIEGRDLPQDRSSTSNVVRKRRGISGFTLCSSSRQSSIRSAFSVAQTYASNAANYLSGRQPSATSRYSTWFGSLTTARWNKVKQHYTSIYQSFIYQPYTFDCTCTSSNTYAYVYPSQPYKVYFCGAFWTATLSGTDSKAGTIVHEASHFTVLGGTQDYAYGQSAAKNLAKSSPDKAVMNADSHEYFAENTPSLT